MSGRMWKAIETKARKGRVAKVERGRKERKKKKNKKKKQKKKRKKKPKKERKIEVRNIAEEWEIWNKEEAARSEKEAKKLVPKRFHK